MFEWPGLVPATRPKYRSTLFFGAGLTGPRAPRVAGLRTRVTHRK